MDRSDKPEEQKKPLSELQPGDVIATIPEEAVGILQTHIRAHKLAVIAMEEAAIEAQETRLRKSAWWEEQHWLHEMPTPQTLACYGLKALVVTSRDSRHPVGTVYVDRLGASEEL